MQIEAISKAMAPLFSPLLSLPVELRISIYDALFAPIGSDLSTQSTIEVVPVLAVCRQICSEATPLLRHAVEARADGLKDGIESHDFSMKAASDLSQYAMNAMKAGRFRSELRRFQALLGILRRMEAMVQGWGEANDGYPNTY
jgi:hypothetical protein